MRFTLKFESLKKYVNTRYMPNRLNFENWRDFFTQWIKDKNQIFSVLRRQNMESPGSEALGMRKSPSNLGGTPVMGCAPLTSPENE